MKFGVVLIAISVSLPALAQPSPQQPDPDPAFMKRAISILREQRNQAADNEAASRAHYEGLVEQLAKAQARIRQLEDAAKETK